jgi:O-antigen ligase
VKSRFVIAVLFLVVGSIAFPIKAHHGAVLVLSIVVVSFFRKSLFRVSISKALTILILLQLAVLVGGLLHTHDLSAGFEDIERFVYPVVTLLLIHVVAQSGVTRLMLLNAFVIGCFALTLYGFVYAAVTLEPASFVEVLSSGHRKFTEYIEIQPLYLAVYFIFIFFYVAERYRTDYESLLVWQKVMLVMAGLLAGIMVVFLRSKTALLVFPPCMIIYLVLILKRRGWWVAFLLLVVAVSTTLLEDKQISLLDNYGRTVSTAFDERLLIWEGALEGIKTTPFFGAGTGGTQKLLNEGYGKIGYQEGIEKGFNAHNQYLQFLARNGIVELVCFLCLLGYTFWKSSKERNHTFLLFTMLVSLVMITESFLSVQKGIAFFYFFLMMFMSIPEKAEGR